MAFATVAALGTVTVATAATGMLMNDAALRPSDDTTATTTVSPETSTTTSPAPEATASTMWDPQFPPADWVYGLMPDSIPAESGAPVDTTPSTDTTLPIATTLPIETSVPVTTTLPCIHGLDVAELARAGATIPDGPPGSIVSEVAKVLCDDDDSDDED